MTDHAAAALEQLEQLYRHREQAGDFRLAPPRREHAARIADDALAAAQVHATLAIAAAHTGHAHEEAGRRGVAPEEDQAIDAHPPLTHDQRARLRERVKDGQEYTIRGATLRAIVAQLDAALDLEREQRDRAEDWEANVMSARAILEEGNQWAELRDALGFPVYTALRSALGYEDQHDGEARP